MGIAMENQICFTQGVHPAQTELAFVPLTFQGSNLFQEDPKVTKEALISAPLPQSADLFLLIINALQK